MSVQIFVMLPRGGCKAKYRTNEPTNLKKMPDSKFILSALVENSPIRLTTGKNLEYSVKI